MCNTVHLMINLSRRRLIATGASGLMAAPFVRLLNRPARAATESAGATRLLIFFTPNGNIHADWKPEGTEEDFIFPEGSIMESLARHRERMIVIDGMNFNTGFDHAGGMAAMLTAGGPDSIDQVVADHIGNESRLKSLELGAQTSIIAGDVRSRMCYRDSNFVIPNDSPHDVFERMFGGFGDPILKTRRQRLIDINRAEMNDLRSRLGMEERHLLDAHLEGLDSVERALSGELTCPMPDETAVYDHNENNNFPMVAQHQIDLAVQALTCGVTNVVTVQLSHTSGNTVFTWLDHTEGHHELSHAEDSQVDNVAKYIECERWYAEQFGYLLDQMISTPDPETGGSLLDSTVVLWAEEIGDGRLHTCDSVPWVIAGNAGGFFRTGRTIDLGGGTHDGVLTSIAQSLGVDILSFGTGTAGPVEALR